ncbi:uncharacterized protein EI97DRAFT_218361 [Westerdykella ornata]|uniref:Gfd2/YDR514C-like C-terminal domain-containing protein n=1 Tax=Westerdykella ornata TaxID=318751 RepID=A0A6A6JUQ3_WESOR|nr:uncharacterized protein EI97DRAFT_218361 [Westerdykella ornata]KAF2278769.1 hypothetical protein EI97DRAFT_218361 [Westerdykella ornata]
MRQVPHAVRTLKTVTKLPLDLGLTSRPLEDVRQVFGALATRFETPHESHLDPIFISIDTGTKDNDAAMFMKNPICDIGVAYLDSRYFGSCSDTRKPREHSHPVIQTHHYLCDPRPGLTFKRIKGRLRFGAVWPELVPRRKRQQLISQIFYHDARSDGYACCPSKDFHLINPNQTRLVSASNCRPVIVVGHSLHQDLAILEQAGFTLNQNVVLHYLDTQLIAGHLLRGGVWSLKSMCKILDINCEGLHVSGNDATYTLVALLKMASMLLGYQDKTESQVMAFKLRALVRYADKDLPKLRGTYDWGYRNRWQQFLERRKYWIYAGIACLAYPLSWVLHHGWI